MRAAVRTAASSFPPISRLNSLSSRLGSNNALIMKTTPRRQASSAAPAKNNVPRFAVHSTFRHKKTGQPLLPVGLQWNLPGKSHVTFVSLDATNKPVEHLLFSKNYSENDDNNDDSNENSIKKGIVQAYNRWAFAREENFATVQDIAKLTVQGRHHVTVEWKDALRKRIFAEQYHADMADMLQKDAAAQVTSSTAAQVWINGELVGHLNGPESVQPIQQALSTVTSRRLAYKQWPGGEGDDEAMIRIERYFGSYLRQKDEIFDHIMDNLIALEDVQALDEHTIIGSATLCDWIMGGRLTSRLWVQEQPDRIRFLRPLRNDDISTSDRKFDLMYKTDPDKVALVQAELARLRHLATLIHPSAVSTTSNNSGDEKKEDRMEEVRRRLAQNRPPRKYFGL